MTITILVLLLGTLLMYAGWTNKAVLPLIAGDNTVSK